MKKIIFTTCIFLFAFIANGQVYLTDPFSGKQYLAKPYTEINGSPFLFEDWKIGQVTDKAGVLFSNVMLRFDIYSNQFFYNYNDIEYEFISDLNKVELFPVNGDTISKLVFRKGFSLNNKVTPGTFVQILSEGKITALKYIYKQIDETTEYNMPGKIKSFSAHSNYFYIKEGIVQSQKPGTKVLEDLTKEKWANVNIYMKQNSLNPKNERDFVQILSYYNSL